jgi:mitochondrial fission protein ELM1
LTLPTTIWVLLTQAPGDNDQSLALLEAIDRPAEIKRLDWPVTDIAEDRTVARALLSETPEAQQWRASLGLCAPWPRLVICCGRRADRVAFWIKEQSGGYTKIVSIGRARMPVAAYDLLIAPPPFLVPERANVVRLPLPLTRRRSLATGDTTARGATIPVPKPWFTILLGGQVKQFAASKQVLTEAARLAQLAARQHGGSVVISTSRRTPPALLAAVESVLERPHIYRWSADGKTGNPYETLLRESAALFVTADSVSMILDCCASGTPTYVIEYPERLDFRARLRRGLFRHVRRVIDRFNAWGLQETGNRLDHAQEWLHARRILRYPRDLRQIHASVYGMGLAHPLSEFDPAALPRSRRPANDLVEASGTRAIAARCRALLQPSALAAE